MRNLLKPTNLIESVKAGLTIALVIKRKEKP